MSKVILLTLIITLRVSLMTLTCTSGLKGSHHAIFILKFKLLSLKSKLVAFIYIMLKRMQRTRMLKMVLKIRDGFWDHQVHKDLLVLQIKMCSFID